MRTRRGKAWRGGVRQGEDVCYEKYMYGLKWLRRCLHNLATYLGQASTTEAEQLMVKIHSDILMEQRAGSEGQYRINPEVVSHAADSAGAPEPSPTPPTDDGTPGEGDSTVLNAEAVSARDAADTPLSPGVPDPQLLAAQTTYGSRLQRAKNAGIDQALSTTTGDETLDELRAKYAALGAAIKERRSA